MSYCALVLFGEDGTPQNEIEFRNAWGGAARIWGSLYERYVNPEGNWMRDTKALWALADDPRLADFERDVLVSTFDNVVVPRTAFHRMASALRRFVQEHPVPGRVDHLSEWAVVFESSGCRAIGFHHTSVSDNPWGGVPHTCETCGHELDDSAEPYCLDKHTKHWDPFAPKEPTP